MSYFDCDGKERKNVEIKISMIDKDINKTLWERKYTNFHFGEKDKSKIRRFIESSIPFADNNLKYGKRNDGLA